MGRGVRSPRFGEPRLTIPIEEALDRAQLVLEAQRPLAALSALPVHRVTRECDEPLVTVDHPRIKYLENYRLGGWSAATDRCVCRSGVLDRLRLAADRLPEGFGFAVFDAWRPLELQLELYEAALASPEIEDWLVAAPSTDPQTPPPHLSGGAIDLTLTIGGFPVELGTMFDDSSSLARAAALEDEPGPAREARRMLYWIMNSVGFVVLSNEWWHFEFGTARWAAITGQTAIYGAVSPADDRRA